MSMTLTVSGTDRQLRFNWAEAARIWAGSVTPEAVSAVKAMAPVSKSLDPAAPKPGRLRDSVSARTEEADASLMVVLYSTVPYAPFVINATRPHTITARNARTLHWVDEGGDHFARSVNHPGTKANPFPERALTGMEPLLASRFSDAIKEALGVV